MGRRIAAMRNISIFILPLLLRYLYWKVAEARGRAMKGEQMIVDREAERSGGR